MSVVCQSNPDSDTFQDQPVVVVEVVSKSTRRIDEGEKCEHYLAIPSLTAYVPLEQDRPAARVYHRDDQGTSSDSEFTESIFVDPDSVLAFPAIKAELRFDDIYAGIEFPAEG